MSRPTTPATPQPALRPPAEPVEEFWRPNTANWIGNELYRDVVRQIANRHFPGRWPSPETIVVLRDADGQMVLRCEVWLDENGDFYQPVLDSTGRPRRNWTMPGDELLRRHDPRATPPRLGPPRPGIALAALLPGTVLP